MNGGEYSAFGGGMGRYGLVLGAALVLAGCGADRFGEGKPYRREAPLPVDVVMAPDATYI